jgi:mannose-6-phosphate isomerase-like protein (cupin superfamily)
VELWGNDFVVVQWDDPGGTEWEWISPLHVHHEDDEAWVVLQGRLRVRIGDEVRDVGAGDGVLAPKGVPHQYGNPFPEPAQYVLVMTPRIAALIEALHRGATDVAELFRAHASELL